MNSFYDYIIVGCGFAGTICARELAEMGKKVLIVEKKQHIGGNMYDYYDKNGLLIHKYGPHIVMTDNDNVYNYLKKYDELIKITVKMEVNVGCNNLPLPINFNAINKLYDGNHSKLLIEKLVNKYGMNSEVNIINLLNNSDKDINEFAKNVYERVFVGYNMKMWGLSPKEIDTNVVGRVPIKLSYDDIRSKRKYNFVPKHGYTNLFLRILDHENIDIITNMNAIDFLSIKNNRVYVNNLEYEGKVIYTGPLDELFNYKHGQLAYRAIYFKTIIKKENNRFESLAVTYPTKYKKFRTSDMSRITNVVVDGKVALMSEYSGDYDSTSVKFNVPSYPVLNKINIDMYNDYKEMTKSVKNLFFIGRLAEFKYYDMSQVIEASFNLIKKLEK